MKTPRFLSLFCFPVPRPIGPIGPISRISRISPISPIPLAAASLALACEHVWLPREEGQYNCLSIRVPKYNLGTRGRAVPRSTSAAPKGRNKVAQGEALGSHAIASASPVRARQSLFSLPISPLRLIGPIRPILAGPPAIAQTTNAPAQDTNAPASSPHIRDVQQHLQPDQAAAAAALKGRPTIAQGKALGGFPKSEPSPERAT
jgi:hypothetical protein